MYTVLAQDCSYSGSGSAVLSSGSTSSIYGMVAPDAVISQQVRLHYNTFVLVHLYREFSDVTLTQKYSMPVVVAAKTYDLE